MIAILQRGDPGAWSAAAEKAGARDVFFSPEYLAAAESAAGGTAECLVYMEGQGVVLYPYIRCPIRDSGYFDITSQYGFGGYVKSPRDAPIQGFADAFHAHCRETGIVSEFVRFHPFYGNERHIEPPPVEIVRHQPMVCVDYPAAWAELDAAKRPEIRKKLKRARVAGVEIISEQTSAFFDEFVAQYRATMTLRKAARFYFFPDAFFGAIGRLIGQRARLFVALLHGQMVGGLLVMCGDEFAYNFLSCSRPEFQSLGTNDLLQVAALEWGFRSGRKRYLLGGGRKGEDSLFRYKARFSSGRASYFLGRRVHLPEVYEALCQERMRSEAADPAEFHSRSWFPLYRAERPARDAETAP